MGFEPMTSAISVQHSTNLANKPTGSWSLCWFQINPWSDEGMAKNIRKSYIWTVDKDVNESDPCSNAHYLSRSENKTWKKIQACMGFEPMTSAISVQHSTNLANKPTGSWSLCWFQINPWSDEGMAKNIRKSYIWTVDKDVNESDPCSNAHYLSRSENKTWKKIQACMGFEPMTSVISVQHSTNWANKPTGSWSFVSFK